jgi:hypothetical protein
LPEHLPHALIGKPLALSDLLLVVARDQGGESGVVCRVGSGASEPDPGGPDDHFESIVPNGSLVAARVGHA